MRYCQYCNNLITNDAAIFCEKCGLQVQIPECDINVIQEQERTDKHLPETINDWNWGAFYFTDNWGVSMKLWDMFEDYRKFVIFAWIRRSPFYYVKNGNRLDWESREWDSESQFDEVQKKWNTAGIVLLCFQILSLFLALGSYLTYLLSLWDR